MNPLNNSHLHQMVLVLLVVFTNVNHALFRQLRNNGLQVDTPLHVDGH